MRGSSLPKSQYSYETTINVVCYPALDGAGILQLLIE